MSSTNYDELIDILADAFVGLSALQPKRKNNNNLYSNIVEKESSSTSIVEGRVLNVKNGIYEVCIANSTAIYKLKSCNDMIYKEHDKVWVVIPEGNKKKMFIMGKVV